MPSLVDAYNTVTAGDRTGDLDRLVDLAKYTAETWPDTEQGDTGRMTARPDRAGPGPVRRGDRGRSTSVRSASLEVGRRPGRPRRRPLEAEPGPPRQGRRRRRPTPRSQKAIASSTAPQGPAGRQRPETDLGLVGNACDLAEIDLETGKPAEALELLEPIAKKLADDHAGRPPVNAAYSPGRRRDPPGPRRHRQGRPGDRRHEDAGGARRRRRRRGPALFRAGQAPRKRDGGPQEEERQGRAGPDPGGLPEVPQGAGRQQVGPDLRVALLGRREPAQARRRQGGRRGLRPDPQRLRQGPGLPKPPNAADRLLRSGSSRSPPSGASGSFDEAEAKLNEIIEAEQAAPRGPDGEGLPPRRQGRGQEGDLGRRLQLLAEPRPEARRHEPQARRVLRGLVPGRPGPPEAGASPTLAKQTLASVMRLSPSRRARR